MSGIRSSGKTRKKRDIYAVVSGSFQRSLGQIQETVVALSRLGIIVLSPRVAKPVSDINGFIILEEDKGSPEQIERRHLSAISRTDFLYVVNPSGYIGQSVALEIGYALSHNVPIYSTDDPTDEILRSLLIPGVPLPEIKRKIIRRKYRTNDRLKASPTLADIQAYVSTLVRSRGFSEEDLTDVALLLFEEIGELSKAIRFETGLKVAEGGSRRPQALRLELADCLIYLADLANLANVDLEQALREKGTLDSDRTWTKYSADH